MSRTVLRARRLCPRRAALICGVRIVLSPFAAAAPAAAADVVLDWNVVLEALNIAQADAAIVNQQWKYTYTFWRPVTAIRWPDDGNPETASDRPGARSS